MRKSSVSLPPAESVIRFRVIVFSMPLIGLQILWTLWAEKMDRAGQTCILGRRQVPLE
jgi:hypothetical protein